MRMAALVLSLISLTSLAASVYCNHLRRQLLVERAAVRIVRLEHGPLLNEREFANAIKKARRELEHGA